MEIYTRTLKPSSAVLKHRSSSLIKDSTSSPYLQCIRVLGICVNRRDIYINYPYKFSSTTCFAKYADSEYRSPDRKVCLYLLRISPTFLRS